MSALWPWVVAGVGVGIVNGLSRWRTVSRVSATAVSNPVRFALGTMALRLGLVAVLLTVSLRQGILPGLSAFVGLFITRWIIVLWFSTRRDSADHRSARQLRR